jgi:hypothetical protein
MQYTSIAQHFIFNPSLGGWTFKVECTLYVKQKSYLKKKRLNYEIHSIFLGNKTQIVQHVFKNEVPIIVV